MTSPKKAMEDSVDYGIALGEIIIEGVNRSAKKLDDLDVEQIILSAWLRLSEHLMEEFSADAQELNECTLEHEREVRARVEAARMGTLPR